MESPVSDADRRLARARDATSGPMRAEPHSDGLDRHWYAVGREAADLMTSVSAPSRPAPVRPLLPSKHKDRLGDPNEKKAPRALGSRSRGAHLKTFVVLVLIGLILLLFGRSPTNTQARSISLRVPVAVIGSARSMSSPSAFVAGWQAETSLPWIAFGRPAPSLPVLDGTFS